MSPELLPLEELLVRIAHGERELFLYVVRRYELGVRSYLAAQIYNQAEVDDLAQEVFIAAFKDLQAFRRDGDFAAWLRGIARNRLLTHFRSRQRMANAVERFREESVQHLAHELETAAEEGAGDGVEKLLRCIALLPEKLRKVVHSGLEGTRPALLAEELGTSVGAVYQLHYRANQLLRACLSKEGVG